MSERKTKKDASFNSMLDETAKQSLKAKLNARLTIARKSEECEIVGLPIERLPQELWSLHELCLLWANNNELRVLDPAVGNLRKLQVIKLNNNYLTRLPDEIGLCSSLVRLWCHNNRLTALPRTMGLLMKLEHLSIEKNDITDLPFEFGRMTSLTALTYDEKKVPGSEPDILGALVGLQKEDRWRMIQSYLRKMDCAHLDKTLVFPSSMIRTPFTQYPNFVTRLVDLRRVCLADHKLPDLPLGVLSCFSSVTNLDLSNNLIRTVHPEIGNLTQLRWDSPPILGSLDLASNPIAVLPLEIGYITSMTSFRIDVKKLLVPPAEISEQGVDSVLEWLKWVANMRQTKDGAMSGRSLSHLPLEVSWVTVLTSLDLSNNMVHTMHPECSTLVHLTELFLNNNELVTLPDSLASFTAVTVLNLDNNHLEYLPDELGCMTALTTLWMRNNKIEALPETIGSLEHVTTFFANHNKLETLPSQFGGMTALVELRLHQNQLSRLPASLSQLQAVTQITMFDNKFTVFPEPVCHMRGVVHALFANNQIRYVPFEVGAMVGLKSLDLEGNYGLEELPMFLGDISQLKILSIECQAIQIPCIEVVSKGIPAVMDHLRTFSRAVLEHTLDLSEYGLRSVPLETKYLTEIRDLNLDQNYIKDFPEVVCDQCQSLTRLSLRGNRFREIPAYFGKLVSLTALNLDDNLLLRRLPRTLIDLPALLELTLGNCQLASPPQDIASRNLREIKEYFGKLVAAEVTHDLDLEGQTLYELPPDVPEVLGLTKLKLSGNHMTTLIPDIGILSNLHTLQVDGNNLANVPEELGHCLQLTHADLSSNQLRDFPYTLQKLTNLHTLLLQENRIAQIPYWFSSMVSLRILNLDSNKITDVPAQLGCLVELKELHLSRNPINQPFNAALCDMTGLRTLKLHESHFTIFPRQFCNLSAITDISFEEQSMKVPPKEVVRHGFQAMVDYNMQLSEALEKHVLDLRSKGFDEVPPEVCTIPGLVELLLDDNLITLLPPQPYVDEDRAIDIYDVNEDRISSGIPDLMNLQSLVLISACNNSLVELPARIGNLCNLETILLDNNQLAGLPQEMGNCTSLTKISMFNNKVVVIPVTFGRLKRLKTFDADWATLIVTPPREISKQIPKKGLEVVISYLERFLVAQEIDQLDLGDLRLHVFPQEIVEEEVGGVVDTIKMLTLADNKLTVLPDIITMLTGLVALDLSQNHILELPENIGEIRSLEALYLDRNKVSILPLGFGDLKNLRLLSVSHCQLMSFPPSIRKCVRLEVLRANNNKFNEVPQTLAMNRSIREMTFDDNKIQNMPQIFRKMGSLTRLNLERNLFKTIPQVFMQWTSLTELRLKGNPLAELPLNFTGLLTIKVAEFDWGDLVLPPQEVARQGNRVVLEYLNRVDQGGKKGQLDLYRLKLTDLPPHVTSMTRLSLVSLSDNEIRVLGEHISSLQRLEVLNLDRNLMPSMPVALCKLNHLVELNVARNRLLILPVMIGDLEVLTKLQAQDNQLKELPESFMQLTTLRHLNIAHNKLESLPPDLGGVDYSLGPFVELFLGGLRHLTFLDLSNNELQEIPKSIRGLTALTKLQMHDNKLHTLPERLKVLKACEKLSVDVKSLTVLKKLKVDALNLSIRPPREVLLKGTDTLVSFYKKILKVENTNRLSLDGLGLKEFPEEITVMTSLLHLSLAHNKLVEIPPTILKIKDLETLDLRDNKIERLPRMARFEGLAEFYIQNNNLAYLPPSVGLMTDLEVLNFANNPLQDPPNQVIIAGNAEVMKHLLKQENVTYTNKLDMKGVSYGGVYLSRFPEPWCNLPKEHMVFVDVSHNWITEIPDQVSKLVELQFFDLSHNRLIRLPSALGALTKLLDLMVDSNRLLHIPEELTRMKRLRVLNVEETYIGIPPEEGLMLKAPGKVLYLLALIQARQSGVLHMEGLQLESMPDDVISWPGVQISEGTVSILDLGVGLPSETKDYVKLKEIHLDRNNLEELPKDIKQLSTVLALNVRDNKLVSLCAELEYLSSLTSLDLGNNQIRAFPRDMRFSPSLTHIKLSNNRFSFLPPNLANLQQIQILHIDGNIIKNIPPELGACVGLQELIACDNQLEELPKELGGLVNLTYLDLHKNRINSLPSSMGACTSITELLLHDNQLIYLPPSMGAIKKIKKLTLGINAIHVLPRTVCKLYSLESLHFDCNGMKKLIPYISNFPGIKELVLSNNELYELPIQIGNLVNLETLRADNNHLEVMYDTIGQLSSITLLDLSYNRLEEVPVQIYDLTTLEYLALDHNYIMLIHGAISSLTGCRSLFLSHNVIRIFPDSVGSLRKLEQLSIGHNEFMKVPDVITCLKSLKELWVSEQLSLSDEGFLPPWVNQCVALRTLHINDDDRRTPPSIVSQRGVDSILDFIRRINLALPEQAVSLSNLSLPEAPFIPFRRIHTLDLSRNKLEGINLEVTGIHYLTALTVLSNRITELPETLVNLHNLKVLLAGQNKIQFFPDFIGMDMPNLRKLDLSHNRLMAIPPSVAQNTTLIDIRLDGNKLQLLPSEMYVMTWLKALHLRDNDFVGYMEEIVEEFGLKGTLRFLQDLHQCKRTDALLLSRREYQILPGCLRYYPNLTRLDFSHNKLRAVVAIIGVLQNLRDVNFRNNKLTDLPTEMGMLPDLRVLDVAENRIKDFPASLATLKNLAYLWMDSNAVKSIPPLIAELESLSYINLDYNQVRDLPLEVAQMQQLRNITMRENRLNSFPEVICKLHGLEQLNLAENRKISFVPSHVHHLRDLQTLFIDDGNMLRLDDNVGFCRNLRILSFAGNLVTVCPLTLSALQQLKVFNGSRNRICFFPNICGLTGLTHLNLSSNEVSTLPLQIGDMAALEEINIDNNKLSELPFTIAALPGVTELDLQANRILQLPGAIGALDTLKELRLHGNRLTSCPATMSALTNLRVLTLRDNHFADPPPFISCLVSLKTLTLGKNKLAGLGARELQKIDIPIYAREDLDYDEEMAENAHPGMRRVGFVKDIDHAGSTAKKPAGKGEGEKPAGKGEGEGGKPAGKGEGEGGKESGVTSGGGTVPTIDATVQPKLKPIGAGGFELGQEAFPDRGNLPDTRKYFDSDEEEERDEDEEEDPDRKIAKELGLRITSDDAL